MIVEDTSTSESFFSACSDEDASSLAQEFSRIPSVVQTEVSEQIRTFPTPITASVPMNATIRREEPILRCHRACFEGDVPALLCALRKCAPLELERTDGHGLTLLHVAAMRDNDDCVKALIDAGMDVKAKSVSGWFPYQEAANYRSRRALAALVREQKRLFEVKTREKLQQLHQVLQGMPDCTFQVSWELGSPILGTMLHKHLPRDTYTVYKYGSRLRIDGHLKGMKEDSKTLLPNWKYGHFSILVNTEAGDSMALFVNHEKSTYTPMEVLSRSGEAGSDGRESSLEASLVMEHSDVKRARLKFSNFKFSPVKGWLTSQVHEKVNGMVTTLYEAHGELMAVTTKKSRLNMHRRTTYEEYLALPRARDREAIVPLSLSTALTGGASKASKALEKSPSPSQPTGSKPISHSGSRSQNSVQGTKFLLPSRHSSNSSQRSFTRFGKRESAGCESNEQAELQPLRYQVAGTGRLMRARMWLTQDSPINQKQLLPLLEIMGSTNEYMVKVCNFMEKYGNLELFPVRVQVPLIMSLRALLDVKNIRVWKSADGVSSRALKSTPAASSVMDAPPDPSFWDPPSSYRHKPMSELDSEYMAKRAKLRRAQRESRQRQAASTAAAL